MSNHIEIPHGDEPGKSKTQKLKGNGAQPDVADPFDPQAAKLAATELEQDGPQVDLGDIDPFDPKQARVTSLEGVSTKKQLKVEVRMPFDTSFFSTISDPAFTIGPVELIKYGGSFFYIHPQFRPFVKDRKKQPYLLYTVIEYPDTVLLCPVRTPGLDGRVSDWWDSAHEVFENARGRWICRFALADSYDTEEAESDLGKAEDALPENVTARDILATGFKGKRMVQDFDHYVMKRLRGKL